MSASEQKHSGIGIASFVISTAAGFLALVVSSIASVLEDSTPGGLDKNSVGYVMTGFGLIGLIIAEFVALGLGIGGLFQKERKKIYAIMGMAYSSVFILLAALAIIFL